MILHKQVGNGVVPSPLRLRSWGRRLLILLAVLVPLGSLGLVIAPTANAAWPAGPYHVTNWLGANVRSGPSQANQILDRLPVGTTITITCQGYGQSVNGSPIWDELVDPYPGGWVSDTLVSTPLFGVPSPGTLACVSAPPPAPTPPPPPPPKPAPVQQRAWGLREFLALSRAAGLIGQTTQSNGVPWAFWCDRFVAVAYGRSSSGYQTAQDHYNDLANHSLIHGDSDAPLGALVFYRYINPHTRESQGHVALSISAGQIITTPAADSLGIYVTAIGHFRDYLGWSWANPGW